MDVQKKIAPVAVKVCGVTSAADLEHSLRCRVPYLGFNFYSGSKRFIAPLDTAGLWAAALERQPGAAGSQAVAVFVGASVAEVVLALGQVPQISVVQIHGPKLVSMSYLRTLREQIGQRQLWLALPVSVPADVEAAASFAPLVDLMLFDSAHVPSGAVVAGGSGISFDWSILTALAPGLPFGVAGGLKPSNLGRLAATLGARRPSLLDFCSGVESSPGVKDHASIDAVLKAVEELW